MIFKIMQKFLGVFVALIITLVSSGSQVFAQNTNPSHPYQRGYGNASEATKRRLGIYFVGGDTLVSCTYNPSGSAAQAGNLDYAGRAILTDAQLAKIGENQPYYLKSASASDIPWQMVAVIHLRESGLARANPQNGQGIYQFVDNHGGPYPTGPVSDAEFQRQTDLAAQFIKSKAGSNYTANRSLSSASGPDVIKDTFFSYNGRASVYERQAQSLGYGTNQGFEGSPYVMNRSDAQRDPDGNKTTWGQVKRDHGPIEYPANGDYGAFVMYASLTGGINQICSNINGTSREKIVQLAQQELELWQTGQLQPGTGNLKYSQGRHEDWCADFASWVYNQAGIPLKPRNEGNIPTVEEIRQIGIAGGRYHEKEGYTPLPGDLVIRKNGESHVNIVISVNGDSMVTIGGNQSSGRPGQADSFNFSKVTQYTNQLSDRGISGYVSPE